MKKYIIPEIKISSFSVEDIITESAATAMTAQEKMSEKFVSLNVAESKVMDWNAKQ